MTKILNNCSCGSGELIMHETEGHVLIVCQACGKQLKVNGTREEAIKRWNLRQYA